MLLKVLKDLRADYLAVAFDRPEPTFRQQAYTQYQAKRPEMEGNLTEQIPLVHELLEALNIPYYEVAGFEADDIIGTLALQATNFQRTRRTQKIRKSDKSDDLKLRPSEFSDSSDISEVVIVTGDRDMLQLVNQHTKVCVPVKGLSETKVYDEQMVYNEHGVTPSQWIDVKALKGDPSDNYPGVSGIGPKTAQDLISKYGTLENLYKHLLDLDSKLRLKLAGGAEDAGLGKKLAAIVTNVPVHLDLVKAGIKNIDWTKGVAYMRKKLGFRAISERVEKEYLSNKIEDEREEIKGGRREKRYGEQIRLV